MVLSPQIVIFRFHCTVAGKKRGGGGKLKTFSTPVLTNGFPFLSPEPLGLICNRPDNLTKETTGSAEENDGFGKRLHAQKGSGSRLI